MTPVTKSLLADVSVIIVNWNAKKYVEECLTSLIEAANDLSVEIILVDNASTDGSVEMVNQSFPSVKVIQNESNLGFAAANNIGIKVATGKYVCLINSDVNVPPNCLQNMYRYMNEQPSIGLLGPKMLGKCGNTRRSGMRFPTIGNMLLRALALDSTLKGPGPMGGFLMADFHFDQIKDMEVLNGWFWMARREALDEVGLLDEQFFMYGEDIDWCKRFRLAGWRIVFYPQAEALHYGGASSANAPIRFFIEMQRANLQYWKKYHGRVSLFFYLLVVWLNHIVRTLAWSLTYLARPKRRSRASSEIIQNTACMRWLLGSTEFEIASK